MIMSSLRARSSCVCQLSIALIGITIAVWSSPALAQTLVSIAVSPASATVGTGSNQQFTATGTYSDGHAADLTNSVTWAAGGPAVSISSSGLASRAFFRSSYELGRCFSDTNILQRIV